MALKIDTCVAMAIARGQMVFFPREEAEAFQLLAREGLLYRLGAEVARRAEWLAAEGLIVLAGSE